MNTKRDILRELGMEDAVVFDGEEFDRAIIGTTDDGRAVYSFDKMVSSFMDANGSSWEDAIEYIDYNTLRSIPYQGEKAPVVLMNEDAFTERDDDGTGLGNGLYEIFDAALGAENMLCKYERFAEHVILSCAMPEVPRYTLTIDSIEGTLMPQAFDLLDNILVRYRKMTAWMRKNGIDPESVAGNTEEKKKHN